MKGVLVAEYFPVLIFFESVLFLIAFLYFNSINIAKTLLLIIFLSFNYFFGFEFIFHFLISIAGLFVFVFALERNTILIFTLGLFLLFAGLLLYILHGTAIGELLVSLSFVITILGVVKVLIYEYVFAAD